MSCLSSWASQTVPIIWPFSVASTQANALRGIIDNANRAQTKYQFVFENKPGAGGTIAVRHLLEQKTPALLMNSTSVFIRPFYYPNESYDVNLLQPVSVVSSDIPIVMISKNIKTLDDLKTKRSVTLSIVPGTIFESTARVIQKNITVTEFVAVPYAVGSVNGTQDLIGGHLDVSIEFIRNAMPWIESGSINALAITGSHDHGSIKTFGSLGIKGLESMVAANYIIAPKSMSEDLVQEFYEILSDAMVKQNVVNIWTEDAGRVVKRTRKDTLLFWNKEKSIWK